MSNSAVAGLNVHTFIFWTSLLLDITFGRFRFLSDWLIVRASVCVQMKHDFIILYLSSFYLSFITSKELMSLGMRVQFLFLPLNNYIYMIFVSFRYQSCPICCF